MSKVENTNVKKRIMFISNEDFYFIAYSILIILDGLNCIEGSKVFKDFRKLSYLISLIKNSELKTYWNKLDARTRGRAAPLSKAEREALLDSYYWSISKEAVIKRILFILEEKQMVKLTITKTKRLDVSMLSHMSIEKMFSHDVFDYEKSNLKAMIRSVKRINILSVDGFVEKIYSPYGVGRCLV